MSDNQYPNTLRVRLRNLSKRDGCLPACALMARRKAPVNLNERVLETNRCHSSLTSRAQARGTNQREPRSGTGDPIPRCLQRFCSAHLLRAKASTTTPVETSTGLAGSGTACNRSESFTTHVPE